MTKHSLATALGVFMLSTASAYDLDQHAWQDRLLLIAAPTSDDPGMVNQRKVVQERADAIADRKLRVFELVEGSGKIDGEDLPARDVSGLRQRFGIKNDDRVMLLVGYDGGVKRRSSIDTDLRIFFLDIDRMPMRQNEIRQKRSAGQPVTEP